MTTLKCNYFLPFFFLDVRTFEKSLIKQIFLQLNPLKLPTTAIESKIDCTIFLG